MTTVRTLKYRITTALRLVAASGLVQIDHLRPITRHDGRGVQEGLATQQGSPGTGLDGGEAAQELTLS